MIRQALFNEPYARLAFGSVTGLFTTLADLTPPVPTVVGTQNGGAAIIIIQSSLNNSVILSFDGGVTESLYLIPNTSGLVIDLTASELRFSGVVSIKHAGVACTSGEIVVCAVMSKV
jgi:hypothetical protein